MSQEILTIPDLMSFKDWIGRILCISVIEYVSHSDEDVVPQRFRNKFYNISDAEVLVDRIYSHKECSLVFWDKNDKAHKVFVTNELYEEGILNKILRADNPDTHPAPIQVRISSSDIDLEDVADNLLNAD